MITSRRLAREWALKILYQVDVGKTPVAEAEADAIDKLRLEFVERGSRAASGSQAERMCLDALTRPLHAMLPAMSPAFEMLLASGAARIVSEMAYWQEVRLETSLRTKFPRTALTPPRRLAPLGEAAFTAAAGSHAYTLVTAPQRHQYAAYVTHGRDTLPPLFQAEFRRKALATARLWSSERPIDVFSVSLESWLSGRRDAYVEETSARWARVGAVVEEHIAAYLRTAAFTISLLHGVIENRDALDSPLADLSSGWSLNRQVSVDRNIMRIAAYEMIFVPSIPRAASINEAVELAKKYSTAESSKFVNGVLGALATHVPETAPPPGADNVADIDIGLTEIPGLEEADTE